MNCPNCHEEVSSTAPYCANCGYVFSRDQGDEERKLRGSSRVFGWLALMFSIHGFVTSVLAALTSVDPAIFDFLGSMYEWWSLIVLFRIIMLPLSGLGLIFGFIGFWKTEKYRSLYTEVPDAVKKAKRMALAAVFLIFLTYLVMCIFRNQIGDDGWQRYYPGRHDRFEILE